jgi:ribosome-binding protein aMBF1 (putative translation factor)
MPGGLGRSIAPREHAADPDHWIDSRVGDPPARVVQHIARTLLAALAAKGWSLRDVASASRVNRQAIANIIAGLSWPDVVTIVRLEDALGVPLWPSARGLASGHGGSSRSAANR